MIDIIIPTMWAAKGFVDALQSYVACPTVNKIIIIDNNKSERPKHLVLQHEKIELVSFGKNVYVNPAWNEGVQRATTKVIGIINDDINVPDEIFKMVYQQDFSDIGVIGVNLRGAFDKQGKYDNFTIGKHQDGTDRIVKLNYNRNQPIGSQAWAFGICMFMLREKYTPIPSLYQVWYGDDYLTQHASTVYAINTNRISGKISETLEKHRDPDSDISKRIELDSKNLVRFDHFTNSKTWDIPRNMISKYNEERKVKKGVFKELYDAARKTPSDINENLHILYEHALECANVVEMGVRTGVSTTAFLHAGMRLRSYDIQLNSNVGKWFDTAKDMGRDVDYIKADVLNIEIEQCDMLFIDTLHTYKQLKQELKLHGNKANKYIAFHDTNTFGLRDEVGSGRNGLLSAVIEFIMDNPHWRFKVYKTNNNGLTVLERV